MILNRYYIKAVKDLKYYMGCFIFFFNASIEGSIIKCFRYDFFDIGFKYLIRVKKINKYLHLNFIDLKIIALETLFSETNILSLNKNVVNKKVWALLKKAFDTRSFLVCQFLNAIKNGFAIGFCGVVGYIPKKYFASNKKIISSVFVILALDLYKKTFILSQKQVNKLASRSLYKLKSMVDYTLNKV